MVDRGTGTTGRLTSPALVGRDEELATLLRAAASPPMVVLVEGEAGVGKTRLVAELLARPELRAHRRLVGSCQELREPFPLGAVIQALRDLRLPAKPLNPVVGVLRPLLPELSESLPPLPEQLHDSRAERHRLFRALRELLSALGACVLVLEDLHWADESTEEFLTFLVSDLPENVAVVLTYRREDLKPESTRFSTWRHRPPVHHVRIRLGPLDPAGVAALAQAILGTGDSVSERFVRFLHERTGGIPFAVEEVLRLLRERGDIRPHSGRWERKALEQMRVPPRLRESVLERVGLLSPEARGAVEAASVVANATSEDMLARVADLPTETIAVGLSEAISKGLLVELEGGTCGFRHVLAREAVYGSIPGPMRRIFHLRCALALESATPHQFAQLAHHFRFAGRVGEWIHYAEKAADLASSVGNDADAAQLLQAALAAPGVAPTQRGRLAAKLGKSALWGAEYRRPVSVLRDVLAEPGLPAEVRGELRLRLGVLLNQAGDASGSYRAQAEALGDLHHRPLLAARAMKNLASPWVAEGHLRDHLRWLERASSLATGEEDPVLKTAQLADRAGILVSVGDPLGWRAAEELMTQAAGPRELQREVMRGYLNIATAAFYIGHDRRADSLRDLARGLSESQDVSYQDLRLDSLSLLLDWGAGRWQGLEDRARAAVEATEEAPQAAVDLRLAWGQLLLARSKLREAEKELSRLAEVSLAAGSIPAFLAATRGRVRIWLARGRQQGAASEAMAAWDVVRRKGIWAWAADSALAATETLLLLGRVGEARALTSQLARGLRTLDAPAARAALQVCRGLIAEAAGRRKVAAERFAGAEGAWREIPRPYEAAIVLEARGRSLHDGGDPSGADVLRQALEEFVLLGARWDAGRARQALRRRGLEAPHHRGRRGYGGRLSPREREVAVLAAQDKTNREISETLFLSPWTVSEHVGNALRKLGLHSRAELTEERLETAN